MPLERKFPNRQGSESDGYYNVVHQEPADTTVVVLLANSLVSSKNVGLLAIQRVGSVTKVEGCLLRPADLARLFPAPPSDVKAIASTTDTNTLPWVDLTTFAQGTGTLYATDVPLGALRITYGVYSATVPNYVIINGV
jgi:hypothetical protein